jgi:hypothetical protein
MTDMPVKKKLTMTSEMLMFLAVSRARFMIQQGQAVPGAAIDLAAKAFDLDERTVAEHVLKAERACDAARELRWRQRRHALSESMERPESSMMASSLSRFDYA